MTLTLGPGLTCDVGTLIDTRLLVQANSGGGKSWALRRLLELTHGKVQHLVIDPEGEFASLREKYDYVLAAKSGGDTAADPRSAQLLAHRLLELGVSAILDIYELKAHDRIRFVRGFLEALVNAPKNLWHPALVVVDEAHVFCPQQGEAESAGAVIDLATRGRKRGFCAVLATQRISKLHKDAAAECNNKLIGRSALDVDMKRAADELGFTSREQQQCLRDLDPGEFFAFGPALSKSVTRGRIGQVQTSHPKAGARLTVPTPPPTARIRAVLSKLADLPAEAEQKQRTEAELRQEIAGLKRQLTLAQRAAPGAKVETKVVEKYALKDGQLARLEKELDRLGSAGAPLANIVGAIAEAAKEIRAAVALVRVAPAAQPSRAAATPTVTRAATPRPQVRAAPQDGGDTELGKAERAVLTVLAQHPDGCAAGKLALLAGYRWSGGFRNSLSLLRTAGYIVGGNGETMRITDAGAAALGDYDPLPTGDDLVRYWLAHPSLGKAERAVLQVLVEKYPAGLTGHALATEAGYEWSGGFRNALSTLRTAGLIVGRNNGEMRVVEDLVNG